MSNKGIVDIDKLNNDMKSVADAIRLKSKGKDQLDWPKGFIDEINNIVDGSSIKPLEADQNPNTRPYDDRLIATFNNINDVDTFCSKYNHDNKYYGGINISKWEYYILRPGNRIQINDGVYNKEWMIAGFDCEYKQKAADDTIYDNGYGIVLIPVTQLCKYTWNDTKGEWGYYTDNGYNGSKMHQFLNSTVSPNLKKVLGNHLVERNVLLSNSTDGQHANSYAWTKAYATLMSIGQMDNTFGKHYTKYDDGEANYQLPVFKYTPFKIDSYFLSRSIYDNYHVWGVSRIGSIAYYGADDSSCGVRPLIYIR